MSAIVIAGVNLSDLAGVAVAIFIDHVRTRRDHFSKACGRW